MIDRQELLSELTKPFPPEAITWKPGNTTKDGTKCMAMAYGDLRAYMERLDELCGLDWSVRYQPWQQERIICELTIHGVTRSSTGEYGTQDEKNNIEGTVAEAQAFKRACAMFGLGRYLYDLPSVWVAFDSQAKKISKEGQAELDNRYRTWYNKAISAARQPVAEQPKQQEKPKQTRQEENFYKPTESPQESRGGNDTVVTDLDTPDAPTEDELDIIDKWRGPTDAQIWAQKEGYCTNDSHAKQAWMNSVRECKGYDDKKKMGVFLHFLRGRMAKQQPVQESVGA